ncbi:hypothetical protein [Pseudomonas sp. FME51]|uniref:hypothetical protein n=1 Tax=Pseudomonas sp. FME51 TaxID=2742609 RepID=UPI001865C93D|nr:hypothetical protein [Pseudomonas sp. FME51]
MWKVASERCSEGDFGDRNQAAAACFRSVFLIIQVTSPPARFGRRRRLEKVH